jgi:hypothetical protein
VPRAAACGSACPLQALLYEKQCETAFEFGAAAELCAARHGLMHEILEAIFGECRTQRQVHGLHCRPPPYRITDHILVDRIIDRVKA